MENGVAVENFVHLEDTDYRDDPSMDGEVPPSLKVEDLSVEDGEEHEELDYSQFKVDVGHMEVFEPDGGSFRKVKGVEKKKEPLRAVIEKEPSKEKEEAEKEERPLVPVGFKGVFGSLRIGYLDVYLEGVYLILVEKIDAGFSYSPPESDDIMEVSFRGRTVEAVSPGISFEMPGQKIKVTVLLKTGEKK